MHQLLVCGTRVYTDYSSHSSYNKAHTINGENAEERGSIKDLSLLARMPNLKILVLDNQNITDISPLRKLSLEKVSLCGNSIEDISPLQRSGSLKELYVEDTWIDDLSPLADKEHLRRLDIGYTRVTSVEPLRGKALQKLVMLDISLKDYSPIYEMPLQELYIQRIETEVQEGIAQIKTLKRLTIYHSNITSIDRFTGLTGLEQLDLWGNSLTDIEGVEKLTNLNSLQLGENPIAELELPPELAIQYLGVRKTNIRDFSFLKNMTKLGWLDVDSTQAGAVEEQMPEHTFTVWVTDE